MSIFVMVSVNSGVPWPKDEREVEFDGLTIRLIPPGRDGDGELRAYPMAVIECEANANRESLVSVIRRFLNGLAWREQAYIREVDVTYGAPLRQGTRVPDNGTSHWLDSKNVPNPTDEKARLALAFYREALDLERIHGPYSFLSLFKVLNLKYARGPEQVEWINKSIHQIRDSRAALRAAEIRDSEPDVGEYLYASGRCAVAHAFSDPLVDPNDIRDQQRLSKDWPLMRGLAALMIQEEWHVPSPPGHSAI
jgi:hypothetical protein